MFRRVVTLLLLPTVLLPPWVSARQCHGCRVLGHESTPHIHWMGGQLPEPDSEGERHPDQANDHCDHPKSESCALPGVHQDATDHHGERVYYLPTVLTHGWVAGSARVHAADGGNTLLLVPPDSLTIPVPALLDTQAPPSLLTCAGSPISLRTLPLLI